jgi:hypothetical protein
MLVYRDSGKGRRALADTEISSLLFGGRFHMRLVVRSAGMALFVMLAAVLLALTSTMTSVITLVAATNTLYIVKGTNGVFSTIPDSQYPAFANRYLGPACPSPCPPPDGHPWSAKKPTGTPVLVDYPASFFPVTPPSYIFSPTFDQSVAKGVSNLEAQQPPSAVQTGNVFWGYSQGAVVVTQYKRDYNAAYPPGTTPPAATDVPTFVLVANPNRPNGGILERFNGAYIPILGVTANGATPTTTAGAAPGQVTTIDVARQYDGWADFPTYPLNVVSTANAIMGIYYLHGNYNTVDLSTATYQGQYGDTKYYLIPTQTLPLLMPLQQIGAAVPFGSLVTNPLVAALDPPLRAIVELGYNRTTSPGVPTPAGLFPTVNPVTVSTDIGKAAGQSFSALSTGIPAGNSLPLSTTALSSNTPNLAAAKIADAPVPESKTYTDVTPPVEDQTPSRQTVQTGSSSTTNTIAPTSTPKPLAPLLTLPERPKIRGPIGGSPSLPGMKDVTSSVNGAVKQATTAVTGAISAVTSAAGHAAAAVGAKPNPSSPGTTP